MKQMVELMVNGENKRIYVRPAATLLHTLREDLGLTGAKPGCENGDCGACTIMFDGRPMKSCLTLSIEAVDHQITTVEGLMDTPIQKAFVEQFAFQCGYCTSGFIMNGHALTELYPKADEYQIKDWLQSNICRCTGYEEIEAAITEVLKTKAQVDIPPG